jgi:deazaflavin-dependent oxidoreductase (nitroreductase family)
MDARVHDALGHYQTIDLTTTGRRTGRPRRIEIALHNLGGRLLISGIPFAGRRRAWLLNVGADPAVTLHLRTDPPIDVQGLAHEVTDPEERRALLERIARIWGRTDLEAMVAHSPLMEITVPGYPVTEAA